MITTVVFIYLAAMMVTGIVLSKRVRLTSDFLVAGRKLGLLLTTATLAAVQLGAGVVIGGAKEGADHGIWPGMWYGIGCGAGLIFAGIFIAARLRKQKGYVPLDYFAQRYGEKKWVRIWGWLSNIPSLLGVFVAQIMAAGTLAKVFGFSYLGGMIVIGLVVAVYSILGGMWSVVVTDLIQVGIIVFSIPVLAFIIFLGLPSSGPASISGILALPFIPEGMFSRAVFLIVPFLLSISISYDAYMRYQSAITARVAKWGCILGGVLVIFISFFVSFIGAAGRKLYPSIPSGDVFIHTIVKNDSIDPIFAGIIISALLAAAMSSANCLLISLSGTFTRDLYNKVLHPDKKLNELQYGKLISRLVIVGALVIGVLVACFAEGILDTMIIFNYPFMGSMLIPLLGGVIWKRGNLAGAIAAMVTGGMVGVVIFLTDTVKSFGEFLNINRDFGLLLAYSVSALTFVSVSLFSQHKRNPRKSAWVDR